MVRSKEDVIKSLTDYFGEEMTDEAISIVEDISDTIDDMAERNSESINWKQKYEENDKAWRKKYTDRFNNPSGSDKPENFEEGEDLQDTPKITKFEELFKVEED